MFRALQISGAIAQIVVYVEIQIVQPLDNFFNSAARIIAQYFDDHRRPVARKQWSHTHQDFGFRAFDVNLHKVEPVQALLLQNFLDRGHFHDGQTDGRRRFTYKVPLVRERRVLKKLGFTGIVGQRHLKTARTVSIEGNVAGKFPGSLRRRLERQDMCRRTKRICHQRIKTFCGAYIQNYLGIAAQFDPDAQRGSFPRIEYAAPEKLGFDSVAVVLMNKKRMALIDRNPESAVKI